MNSADYGLHHLKSRIVIQAPVEICYDKWRDFSRFPAVLKRVVNVYCESSHHNENAILTPEEMETRLNHFKQDIFPSTQIKHWLLAGPGGKLYEVENATLCEIPNRLYATISTDPNDISAQSCISFCPDANNQNTRLDWHFSFWSLPPNGKATQLGLDVLKTGDSFLEDCLKDFKRYVEGKTRLQTVL